LRFIKPTSFASAAAEPENAERKISVDLDGATKSRNRLFVGAKSELGEARKEHPEIGVRIDGTKGESA